MVLGGEARAEKSRAGALAKKRKAGSLGYYFHLKGGEGLRPRPREKRALLASALPSKAAPNDERG